MFLGYRADDGPWTSRDRELAKALLIHEASLCEGCHLPLSETTDPDREGWYLVESTTCAACRARDIEMGQVNAAEPGMLISVRSDPAYEKRS